MKQAIAQLLSSSCLLHLRLYFLAAFSYNENISMTAIVEHRFGMVGIHARWASSLTNSA